MHWDIIKYVLSCVKETISFVTATIVSLIAIYTFYRTFISQKIKFLGFGHRSSIWEGDCISVSIQNWTLSTIGIQEISMIVDDKYSIAIKKFEEPFILDPLRSTTICSENFTRNELISSMKFLTSPKKLMIETGDNVIYSKMRNRHFRKVKHYMPATSEAYTRGNEIITVNMLYIVYIISNSKSTKKIIILKNGMMNCTIDGKNALPPEILSNKENIEKFFRNWINDVNVKIIVDDYSVESICNR